MPEEGGEASPGFDGQHYVSDTFHGEGVYDERSRGKRIRETLL
jgi:hypothetical protein